MLEAWTGTWLSPRFASWSLELVLAGVSAPTPAIHGSDDDMAQPAMPS